MAGEQRPPPRVLNVQRFADARSAELQSLHAIVAERVGSDFRVPRRTRRRTSSFLNRRNPNCRTKSKKRKRPVGQVSGEDGSKTDPEVAKERKCQNRRVRRRMEFKGNPSSGFSLSGDGTKRLRTHVWHAKRFEMVKRWGFYLPLGLSGRGRGSRSILKQLKSECFIHDASYFSTVQLEGAEKSILTILDEVLVPPPSSVPEEYFKPVLNGASYGQSMLYHAGVDSQAISPVTYMWRPLVQTSTHSGTENGASDVHDFLARNNAGCSKLVSPDVGEEGTNSTFSESFNLEHAEHLASHAILSLSVVDPRVAKLPSFPYDFPDCKAYADHMACEAVAFDKKVESLPPSRKLMRIPIPPPWNCIKLPREGRLLTQSNEVSPCLLTGVNVGLHDDRAFQGFVARTSASLLRHVNDIHVDHMILYPDTAPNDSCAELANGTSPNWTTSGANTSPVIQKGCFVRTVLYANKRGVFEEGASVCVPTSDDYSLWSRPNEQEQLQIPLTLLRSYFTQQSFDKWQMQVPEGPGTKQFHRQLIGFVTTDFVRGSVKPAAEALCEFSMLAQLSKEQPTQKGKGKNQVMVLVRNPTSIVFRPGLATVLLQQQEDDLSFM
ncbi:Ribonucleases P/MRP protein subunit [Nymphaea thermarum]|nr:Ribonucleases P/MRP protein subunit [Nymphaea thermarum]